MIGGRFGTFSRKNLERVKKPLVMLAERVTYFWDSTVTDGIRTLVEQKKNILNGSSKTMDSKHLPRNASGELDENGEAEAIDMIPTGTDWGKIEKGITAIRAVDPTMQVARAYYYCGFVAGIAAEMGLPIRQGCDWNSDGQVGDHTFIDIPHVEMKRP